MPCPKCGSEFAETMVLDDGSEVAVCRGCAQLYIPENRTEPCRQLCDDCAFRPGSPERADGYKWAEIIQVTIVDAEHPFFCHKGMTARLDGETLRYEMPPGGQNDMTPCAGWKAHRAAYLAGTPARKL